MELFTCHRPSTRPAGISNTPEADPKLLVVSCSVLTFWWLGSNSVTVNLARGAVWKRPLSSLPL